MMISYEWSTQVWMLFYLLKTSPVGLGRVKRNVCSIFPSFCFDAELKMAQYEMSAGEVNCLGQSPWLAWWDRALKGAWHWALGHEEQVSSVQGAARPGLGVSYPCSKNSV